MLKNLPKLTSKQKNFITSFLFMLMMVPFATFCDPTAESVMKGVIDIIFEVAKYVGIVLCVSGIFQLVLAYKDDNADGQSRAVRLVVVALALLSLKTLVKMTGLI